MENLFDKNIRTKLQEVEITPSGDMWDRIDAQLDEKEEKKAIVLFAWMKPLLKYGIAASVAFLLGAFTMYLFNNGANLDGVEMVDATLDQDPNESKIVAPVLVADVDQDELDAAADVVLVKDAVAPQQESYQNTFANVEKTTNSVHADEPAMLINSTTNQEYIVFRDKDGITLIPNQEADMSSENGFDAIETYKLSIIEDEMPAEFEEEDNNEFEIVIPKEESSNEAVLEPSKKFKLNKKKLKKLQSQLK